MRRLNYHTVSSPAFRVKPSYNCFGLVILALLLLQTPQSLNYRHCSSLYFISFVFTFRFISHVSIKNDENKTRHA